MARKLWIFDQPITRVIRETRDQRRWEGRKMPTTKKQPTMNNKKGKASPSRETNHHFSGCRKGLAQASRKKTTATMFSMINNRRVRFRRFAMTCPKLQIFFVCGPFQDLFFLISKKTVALLIDLVEDLIDPLLGHIGDLFERLSAGYLVVEFVLG